MRFLAVFGLCAAVFAGGDIDLLVGAAKDPERGVRYAAVQALGKAGAGIETLIAALDDSEWCVRQAAGHALARVGKSAVPALTRAARSTKTHVRVEAIEALRRIGTNDAMAVVVAALDDKDPLVVREALDGIWLHGKTNATAVPGIERYLDSEDADLMVTAHWALLSADPTSVDRIRKRLQLLSNRAMDNNFAIRWTKNLTEHLLEEPPEPPREFDPAHFARMDAPTRRKELGRLRALGTSARKHEKALRDLLQSKDKGLVRDAAIALQAIGDDPRDELDDGREWNALLFCPPGRVRADDDYKFCRTAEEFRDWALVIGRGRKTSAKAKKVLGELADHKNPEVRAAAVWALGHLGIETASAVGDSSLAVRTIAARFVTNVDRLRDIARGTSREPAVLAIRRLGELGKPDSSPEILGHADPLIRIAAVLALGKHVPETMADDDERDVRIAVAMQRAIPRQLRDANWRVRLESIRSHGRARLGAEQLALFLSDPNLALSNAAAEVLPPMRARAARPVARLLTPGNPGVWHYAARIFEQLGPDGTAAVPDLIPTLQHADPTARETAARCLASIGASAHSAAPALTAALADHRVGVVSHAALALGRIGALAPVRSAMTNQNARVRAYATFAMGWALGAERKIDQVPYEPRLPLLDSGEPDQGVVLADIAGLKDMPTAERNRLCRRGIRSKDPRIAYPCAALLEYDEKSPWECDRTTELIIAEGFRPGHKFDIDTFRYALGSNELPACLEFMMYPRETEWARPSIYGQLHRAPRSSNIPALCWFSRTEDAIRLEDFEYLAQPFSRTSEYRAELERYWGGTIWELIERGEGIWAPERWWLRDESIPSARVPLLIGIADVHLNKDDEQVSVVMRALGRATDTMSEQHLRRAAASVKPGPIPLLSLARRGDPVALVRAIEAAADDEALGLLMEFLPSVGGALLRERMQNATDAPTTAANIDDARRHGTYMLGVEWTFEPFLGLESRVAGALLDADKLAFIMQVVPGCRTQRLGNLLIRRLANGPPADIFEADAYGDCEGDSAGLAWSVAPKQVRAHFRRWAASSDKETQWIGIRYLARVAEEEDAKLLAGHAAWIAKDKSLENPPPWLRDLVVDGLADSEDADPSEVNQWQRGFWLEYGGDTEMEARIEDAARSNNALAFARSILESRLDIGIDSGRFSRLPRLPWIRHELERRYAAREYGSSNDLLGSLALWPGNDAKAEYWSALRAGRYMWIVDDDRARARLTLGYDFTTLPHWRHELESNCCRTSGALASIFEDLFEITNLYSCHKSGHGEPPSDRVLDWFELMGGDVVWSPIARRYLPRPE